jgi:hypothetical protein
MFSELTWEQGQKEQWPWGKGVPLMAPILRAEGVSQEEVTAVQLGFPPKWVVSGDCLQSKVPRVEGEQAGVYILFILCRAAVAS